MTLSLSQQTKNKQESMSWPNKTVMIYQALRPPDDTRNMIENITDLRPPDGTQPWRRTRQIYSTPTPKGWPEPKK